MKITKRQLKRIIKEEKAKILAENRMRKAVREALLKEAVPGGDPEEFGGTAGYDWVKTSEVEVGDYVEVSGSSGTVSEIDLFTTTLNTPQNLQVLLPNAAVYGKTITNYSANETRRVDVGVGIGYEDDIGSAMRIIEEITAGDPRVLSEPASAILVSELADSSVNLTVRAWCERTDYGALRSDLLRTLKEKLEAGGCSIPFPQQDVHIVSNTAPK